MPGNDGIGLLETPALRVFLWEGMIMPNPLYRQHIISISDLTTEQLELLLQTALKLKKQPREDLLEGKLIGSCFFEPSTRTRLSFETAVQRLGGKVIGFSDGLIPLQKILHPQQPKLKHRDLTVSFYLPNTRIL